MLTKNAESAELNCVVSGVKREGRPSVSHV